MALRPLIAGNWKMNGLRSSVGELKEIIAAAATLPGVELMVCPPATLIADFAAVARGTPVVIGGQDCHPEPRGAFTGDISAEMLRDAGAQAVILGHSERRRYHGETSAVVRTKALAARRAGLTAIVCVGETRAERAEGRARAVVEEQLVGSCPDGAENLVIAYEPVWAIGTGVTPTRQEIGELHEFIRRQLVSRYGESGKAIRILYGGSVKPANAKDILMVDDVNGALVGGASLIAGEFLTIAGILL